MKTTVGNIISAIESFAPLAAQDSFDNSGFLVGRRDNIIDSILVCVDVSDEVFDQAVELGAGMIVSHHPLIFNPILNLTHDSYPERLVERAIRNNIAIYAAHTNLDAAIGGMSYVLAQQLGVQNPVLLGAENALFPGFGYGVVGELERAEDTMDFLRRIKNILNIGAIRHSAICKSEVKKVALSTGSGSSHIKDAITVGADIYLSADFKYNNFIDADRRIVIADLGHFETEYCAIDLIYDIITKKIPTFAIHKSANSRNPVSYLV